MARSLQRQGMGLYGSLLLTYNDIHDVVKTRNPELLEKFEATFRSSSLSSAAD
jgi:hypothetical protein